MTTNRSQITSSFLSLILLVAICFASISFSGSDFKHSEKAISDLADKEISEKEDCQNLKEKFANYNSKTTRFPKLMIALADFNTDLFTQKFFLSVPISPPNS
ncbi:MAG: hypothetical protein V4612_03860 [Pseudomonadota bacterium]